jgi:alpha-glucosidase
MIILKREYGIKQLHAGILNFFTGIGLLFVLTLSTSKLDAQGNNDFEIKSPDGSNSVHIVAGAKLEWSVLHKGNRIIEPSSISMRLEGGQVLGDNAQIISHSAEKVETSFRALNYKKTIVMDQCNQLTIDCNEDYGVIFRVYNDAVAYRFFTKIKGEIVVKNEEANFNFKDDHKAFIPYMWDYRDNKIFNSSFEALYKEINISKFASDSLAFLPLLVDVGNNEKVEILEADLENYPGMYLNINQTHKGFIGVYAPYPLEAKLGGDRNVNYIPVKRGDYIAKTDGTRNFPWRAIVISDSDKELLDNDIVQKLASPPRIKDLSWIKTGQVAWDWWNNRNITHVDFKAGQNTATYKYYIDFAAAHKVKYIMIDGGWTDRMNLEKVLPEINLREIIDYGNKKGVGVFVWALWYTVTQQKDKFFPLFSKMGVKGLKIDFVDRDDQVAVVSLYEIAKQAAENKLLVDFHGVYKPTGLQRTYPNVIGFEGVKGLENVKWAVEDAPRYAVTIPFIRMMAGPMDYTSGAMRNSNKANFRPINDMPMSQGTRCHQLAMFVVYDAPLQMLSDNPTIYMREKDCTDFITSVPTTFDETVPLDGKVGEYAALAHKKGDTWYVGAMSNWDARDLTLDFSFLEKGTYKAVIFKDGVNADRDATDYKKETINLRSGDKLKIQLSTGGGWAARISPVK